MGRHAPPLPLMPLALGLLLGVLVQPSARLLLGAGIWLMLLRKPYIIPAAVLISAACGSLRAEDVSDPAEEPAFGKQLVRAEGFLLTATRTNPPQAHNPHLPYAVEARTSFEMQITRCNGVPRRERVRVHLTGNWHPLPSGAAITVTGWRMPIRPARNPGEPNWRQICARRGMHAALHVPEGRLIEPSQTEPNLASLLRGYAADLLEHPNANASTRQLLRTLVLGHRSQAGAALNERFARTGSLHYLAVSGFHVGLVLGTGWWLLRQLTGSERIAAIGGLALLGLQAACAEPNAPVQRAAILGAAWCLSRLLQRSRSTGNVLSGSALILLWWQPDQLQQPGFQLSFLQVTVLLWLGPHLQRPRAEVSRWSALLWQTAWHALRSAVLISVVSWLVATPLVALHFGRVAPWGALQNILLLPGIVLLLWLGLLHVALAACGCPLLLAPVHGCAGLVLDACGQLGRVPHALLEIPTPSQPAILACYAIGAVLAWQGRTRLAVCLPAVLLMCVSLLPGRSGATQLCVLDVGAGSAAMLQNETRCVVLDVGTRHNRDVARTLERARQALGLSRPHEAWISHANLDHYSGLDALRRQHPAMRVYSNRTFAARDTATPTHSGLDAACEILWPPADLPDWVSENDRSLVLRWSLGPWTVLAPGDAEGVAMSELLAANARGDISLQSDIMLAPHHGSVLPGPTRAFYQAVKPRIVLVSSDRARPELAAMLGSGIVILNTADVGAITLQVEQEMLRVRLGAATRPAAAIQWEARDTEDQSVRR